jgi:hypothetical protein
MYEDPKSRFAHFFASGIARDDYDVFFSYRWNNFDSAFTSKAFDNMTRFSIGDSKHPVYVFLDRERLKAGDNFQEAFATALIHSSVVVPIVSAASFEKLMDHNPSDVDNMLVEWILALEAYESKATRVERVFPIFIGCEDPISKKVDDLIDDNGTHKQLPAISPTASMNTVVAFLKKNGITPRAELVSGTLTIRGIVEQLLQHLGMKLSDVPDPVHYARESCRRIYEVVVQTKEGVVSPSVRAHSLRTIQSR